MGRKKKSNKVRNIVLGITIPLVLILITFSTIFMTRQTGYPQGFTVLSISSSRVISSDTDLSDTWILVNLIANAGGQSLIGTVTPEQTSEFSNGKFETKYPIEISLSAVDETVDYPIINDGTPIYTYTTTTAESGNPFTTAVCPQGTTYEVGVLNNIGRQTLKYCIKQTQVGIKGHFKNPNIKFKAIMKLEVNGKELTKEIGTADVPSSIEFMDGTVLRATAQWTGSLITGDSPPNQDNFVPILYFDDDKWRLISKDDWNKYNNYFDIAKSELLRLQTEFVLTDVTPEEKIKSVLQDTLNQISVMSRRDLSLTSGAFYVSRNDQNNAKVRLILDRALTYPSFIIKVKADWVGIKIPVGKPDITSIKCPISSSGEEGKIIIDVKNKGTTTSSIRFSTSGCEPLQQKFSSESLQLGAGELQTITLELTGSNVNEEFTKVCKVRAYDFNRPSNYDEASVSCKVTKAKICVPDSQSIIGKCIYKCNSAGTNQEELKCCDISIDYDSETKEYKCSTLDKCGNKICEVGETAENCPSDCTSSCGSWIKKLDGSTLVPNLWCKLNQWILSKVILSAIIFGVLTFLVALFVIPSLAERYNIKNQNKLIPFIISLVIGIITFVLVLWLWWLFLIIIFLLILIKLFFKK